MKRLFLAFAACLLAACATTERAAAPSNDTKVAFDVTTGNPTALQLQLATIDLTRKQLIEAGRAPHIVVTFRGDASYFTQTDLSMVKEVDRADALAIRGRIKELKAAQGVDSLEQCNVPLAARKIRKESILPEVKLVPNGWIALMNYQQQGYAYISP
jgi:intracellular sulfur oxidation DsrE/DsrF family protein